MTAAAPASVTVSRARVAFGRTVALDGVDLFAAGGVVALLGPNGAGKSTLLRCLATARALDGGTLTVDGLDPTAPAQRTEIRRRLGYLPQRPAFSPPSRVVDVVDYLAICKGLHDERRRNVEVRRVLAAVGLADLAGARVRTLSGGTLQRLALAQALLGRPSLLVLDEPATGLDPEQRLVLRSLLSHEGERATVVISTHLTDEAAAFSQRVVVLDAGRVRFAGTPAELASTATGRVWTSPVAPPEHTAEHAGGDPVQLAWRTPEGSWRCLGGAPPAAAAVSPTLEDAYLLMVGARGRTPPQS